MEDEETGEQEELDEAEPSQGEAGFGEPAERPGQSISRARQAGQAAGKIALAAKNGAIKFLGAFFGPGSKIKVGLIVINVPILLISFAIIFVGLSLSGNARQGDGGTSPQVPPALAAEETKENLDLIACLDQAPALAHKTADEKTKGETDDTAKTSDDDSVRLSDHCIKINREQVAKVRTALTSLEEQLKNLGDDKQLQANATELLGKLRTELTGIDEANGRFRATKEHVDAYGLLVTQFVTAWGKLSFNCNNIAVLLGAQSPQVNDLFLLKSHRTSAGSPIKFYYDAESWSNAYASHQMACYLAKLTVEAQKRFGFTLEVSDVSQSDGGSAWGPHHQHGGGGNVDIWAPKVMPDRLEGSTYDDATAQAFAKLIRDFGAQELFIWWSKYPPGIQQYSIDVSEHANHWHICIHDC